MRVSALGQSSQEPNSGPGGQGQVGRHLYGFYSRDLMTGNETCSHVLLSRDVSLLILLQFILFICSSTQEPVGNYLGIKDLHWAEMESCPNNVYVLIYSSTKMHLNI